MCGIAGIIGRANDTNHSSLRRMSASISHRGPDGEGFYTSPTDPLGNACLLSHRRLSILDLSTCASQPMTDPVTGNVIAFNGEIYNYPDLRDDLARSGQSFQSTGDTAVMLRALSLQGPSAVQNFRGMFAFALWDNSRRQLTLARDPLGIKPLYIARNPDPSTSGDWSIAFASELRALLASGLIAHPRLNPAAASSIVWNGFITGPHTAVQHIDSLWPGELLTFDSAGRQTHSEIFADIPRPNPSSSTDDEQDIADTLRTSVHDHLASDVPLGVFLSGGVDSSAVANLAQQSLGSSSRINTFTLCFEDPDLDESPHARKVAAAIGTNHHEILLRESDFLSQLNPAIDSLDQPTFDGLNSYFISRAVRDAGLKVALIGTGGDELFGGYTSFRRLPPLHRLSNSSSWLPTRAKRAAASAIATVTKHPPFAKLPGMLEDGQDLIALYQHAYALFLPETQRQLLAHTTYDPLYRGLSRPMYESLERQTAHLDPRAAISILEARLFLGQRLLRDTDAASMACSLEVRLPLVDRPLWESASRVTEETRYEPMGKKSLLRRIGLKGLDPQLFERPKRGFVLPFDRWLQQGLGAEMDTLMRDPNAANSVGLNGNEVSKLWHNYRNTPTSLYWTRIWAIYVFIRWCHQYGVLL
jgi:asparagine synthase (glutamine-hydrolysing)